MWAFILHSMEISYLALGWLTDYTYKVNGFYKVLPFVYCENYAYIVI